MSAARLQLARGVDTARRGGIVLTLAALALAALTAALGLWQLDRARQKSELQAALDRQRALPALVLAQGPPSAAFATEQQHRAVVVEGEWLAARTVYLDNRPMAGRVGLLALTPLALADGSAVLVQRGWFARDPVDRSRISVPAPPSGRVRVQGRIALAPSRLYELGPAALGAIRQNVDLVGYARETGLRLAPLVIVQEDGLEPPSDGLLRRWPQPAADVHKNYGYAVQWFALCTLVTGLYVWFQFIRPRRAVRS